MVEVYTPEQVEAAIRGCSQRIAHGVQVCDERYRQFMAADAAYDRAFARAYLAAEGPQMEKKYRAELATEVERDARDVADAAFRHADKLAKALENELRAWQSVGASIRAMYSVAGVAER